MEYGTEFVPSACTIQLVCKEGMADLSPAKVGRPSALEDFTFLTLVNALKTFLVISQINGQGGVIDICDFFSRKIKSVLGNMITCSTKLLHHVLQETVIDLVASKSFTVEQRRMAWTNYNNLKMWFRNWELLFRQIRCSGF